MQITIELPDDIANQLQLQPANISLPNFRTHRG
jgi:hypothetical protein